MHVIPLSRNKIESLLMHMLSKWKFRSYDSSGLENHMLNIPSGINAHARDRLGWTGV